MPVSHFNCVRIFTVLAGQPQAQIHPVSGLVTAVVPVTLSRGQTLRAEVPPLDQDDAFPKAVLSITPKTVLYGIGQLTTRAYTRDYFDDPGVIRRCPYCGAPYAGDRTAIEQGRVVRPCQSCGMSFAVARQRVHTLLTIRRLRVLPGPGRPMPAGSQYEMQATLVGVLGGRPVAHIRPGSGLTESRFRLAVHRPNYERSSRQNTDYPWVYVLPQNGNDGLAKSILRLGPGDPVLVDGYVRARRHPERAQIHETPLRFCPACGSGWTPERVADNRSEGERCRSCGLVVTLTYQSTAVEVVANAVEFLNEFPQSVFERRAAAIGVDN